MSNILAVIAMCAPMVSPATLLPLVHHESNASPYRIGINGGWKLKHQPKTKEEAVHFAKTLVAQGYNIDMGDGQINYQTMLRYGSSFEQVFDRCTNINLAGRTLQECYERAKKIYPDEQQALQASLSCYNTGSFTKGKSNGYVRKVYGQARRLQNSQQ